MKLTLRYVRRELAKVDVTVRCRSDYRVNYKGGNEATAYYTNDLQDALDTGLVMGHDVAPAKARMQALVNAAKALVDKWPTGKNLSGEIQALAEALND